MEETSIGHFVNRKIALVGDGRSCRHFYLQFRSALNLQYYFSTQVDKPEHDAENSFEDLPELICMPFKASIVFEQDLLLILCVAHPFRQEYDRLFFLQGLEWGKDYIDMLYVIQYFRHKYDISLLGKKLWIFGAGNNGKYFYQEYLSRAYFVAGFLSNFEEEKECLGLPVIRPSELEKEENVYIVICSDSYMLMTEKLCELGFCGVRDFCFMDTAPKALFMAIGTCQLINSSEFLYQNAEFNSRYYGCSYFENIYESFSAADNERLKNYGEFCDIVLYNIANVNTSELRNYEPLILNYYKNARLLFMPFYYFKGQMMQATDNINIYGLRRYEGHPFWDRGDQEVNHMVEKNYSIDRIVEEVLRDDYWSREEILDHFRRELKKIEVLDRFSSFPIKGFIEENFHKMIIFVDGTHFNYPLYLYLANKIAEALQINPMSEQEAERKIHFPLSVMPIYPCVQKALHMEAQSSYPFLHKGNQSLEYIDIKEYIKRYARYVMDVRDMYIRTGTNWV